MKGKMLAVVVAGVSMSFGVSAMAQCCGGMVSCPVDTAKVEASAAAKAQATCPVLGGAIDKAVFADADGYRVYFCCAGCVDTFKKDPAKYIKILKDKGEAPEKLAASCPVDATKKVE